MLTIDEETLDDPRFLPVALGNGGLCFHDQRNGDAWLASTDSLDLHEWR